MLFGMGLIGDEFPTTRVKTDEYGGFSFWVFRHHEPF
jgi:hypothetical protein